MPKYLLKIENQKITDSFLLEEGLTNLGRDDSNQIKFERPEISRKHARLNLSNGQVNLIDLGSAYGVWVNGEKIQYIQIDNGVKFKICDAFDLCISEASDQILIQAVVKTPLLSQTIADGMSDFEFSSIPKTPDLPTELDSGVQEPIFEETIPSHFKDRADEFDQSFKTEAKNENNENKPVLYLDPSQEADLFPARQDPQAHLDAQLNALLQPLASSDSPVDVKDDSEDEELDSTHQPSEDASSEDDFLLPFKANKSPMAEKEKPEEKENTTKEDESLSELLESQSFIPATLKYEINPITLNQGLGDFELPQLDTPNTQKLDYVQQLIQDKNAKSRTYQAQKSSNAVTQSVDPQKYDFASALRPNVQAEIDTNVPKDLSERSVKAVVEDHSNVQAQDLAQSQDLAQAQVQINRLQAENQLLKDLLISNQQIFAKRFSEYADQFQAFSDVFPHNSVIWRQFLGFNVQLKQDLLLFNPLHQSTKKISLHQVIRTLVEKSQMICPLDFKLELKSQFEDASQSENTFLVSEQLTDDLYALLYFYVTHAQKTLSLTIEAKADQSLDLKLIPDLSQVAKQNTAQSNAFDFEETFQNQLLIQKYLLKKFGH